MMKRVLIQFTDKQLQFLRKEAKRREVSIAEAVRSLVKAAMLMIVMVMGCSTRPLSLDRCPIYSCAEDMYCATEFGDTMHCEAKIGRACIDSSDCAWWQTCATHPGGQIEPSGTCEGLNGATAPPKD